MRTIADLPWRGTPVLLRWEARRYVCPNAQWSRRIFAEPTDTPRPQATGVKESPRVILRVDWLNCSTDREWTRMVQSFGEFAILQAEFERLTRANVEVEDDQNKRNALWRFCGGAMIKLKLRQHRGFLLHCTEIPGMAEIGRAISDDCKELGTPVRPFYFREKPVFMFIIRFRQIWGAYSPFESVPAKVIENLRELQSSSLPERDETET